MKPFFSHIYRTLPCTTRGLRRFAVIGCTLALAWPVGAENMTENGAYSTSYSSSDAGLVYHNSYAEKHKVYYRWHLQRLSQTLSPRYIRFLDVPYSTGEEKYSGRLHRGLLLTYYAPHARRVSVAGNFSNWRGRLMHKNARGVWYIIIPAGGEYNPERLKFEYKFNIDGIWDYDHTHTGSRPDGYGSYISSYTLHEDEIDINKNVSIRRLPEHMQNFPGRITYEFRIYMPEARNVFLVGNFNSWNPDHDPAVKGRDGIWRIRKSLEPGEYLYRYMADGRPLLDRNNPRVMMDAVSQSKASYLKVKDGKG